MSAVVSVTQPQLRPMYEADLAAVLEVEQSAYEFPWSLSILRDCLRVKYECFVYEDSRGLMGHGIISMTGGECHLLNVCIHPDYQRRGFGSIMVNRLLAIARRKNARLALLEVRVSNTAAFNLYVKLGFGEIGMRKGYYPARFGREDAIILAREL